ncbi:MAG: NAD(+) synthase [Pirellulales bacterium]|nr:NAD(+) synthase [Pirellulales bacterium]
MNQIKLAAAALNQTPLAWETNKAHILAAIDAARDAHVGILCLPELCITGYGCEDLFHSPGVVQTALDILGDIVPATRGIVVAIGLPVPYDHGLYDAAAFACNGKLLGIVGKQHLAGDGIHYEPRWFRRWSAGTVGEIVLAGNPFPLGDLIFDCSGVRIGFEICEDAWVPNRPGHLLAQRGVHVILNPSASHFAFGKQKVREQFVVEGSRAFGVSYVYANLLGNEAGRAIYDGGSMIASHGKLLACGERFSYADWQLTTAIVDIDITEPGPRKNLDHLDEVPLESGKTISMPINFPALIPEVVTTSGLALSGKKLDTSNGKDRLLSKEEEFAHAVALALFDYLRKSHSNGFVVSLSGGADSSAVALLVWLAVRLGVAELGEHGFLAKLGQNPSKANNSTPAGKGGWMHRLLTCVYQSTRNSSAATLHAARTVAELIGAEFLVFDVDELVQRYQSMVAAAIGRNLDWKTDDLALQNIQARARGPSVWLLANLRGALLLTTSNRSEAAVGYATMDGDTCGGLAPIAGIDKAFLRHWLRWMESTGLAGIGPLPELAVVNEQQPTAELRPSVCGQIDEDDLMPYDVLDAIERAAIRDKLLPIEVYTIVSAEFTQYDKRQLGEWIDRFYRLWCHNQWKRERYAPSFHLDDENLDPKTWCRFPILSGGYERELAALHEHLGGQSSSDRKSDSQGRN